MAKLNVSGPVYRPGVDGAVHPQPGTPLVPGATLTDTGTAFAVAAPNAASVAVCLFDGSKERRFALTRVGHVWAGHVDGVRAGTEYGYRALGPWNPAGGMYFNPAKLLLDPYGRAVTRTPELTPALYAHTVTNQLEPATTPWEQSHLDSAPVQARSVVLPDQPAHTAHPFTLWARTVVYEAHVKGMTRLAPWLPEELRGTYAGMAHPDTIRYLKDLGVTAVELLPIHAKMSEPHLASKELTNYWGYSTLGYFAPEPSLATVAAQEAGPAAVVAEVKQMVDAYHRAGLEVILDVVYNHTAEGGPEGPTLSWRGLDASAYYMRDPGNPGHFVDTTGTGNTLDFRRQDVVRMALDSMRYWVRMMGVDGFRFDLAVTLARKGDRFDTNHPFYVAAATDPILEHVKLFNEPWDVGPNGWQTGNFPEPTADWNDRFRDSVRAFWVSDRGAIAAGGAGGDMRDLATRLAGSADMFGHGHYPGGRGPNASVNLVTVHDGFTLRDLVSYNFKHNEANGEEGRDGTTNNRSWNHGVEGDAGPDGASLPGSVAVQRKQTIRNLLGTLLLSAGTPLLLAGDEIGRTQHGNNNAYCQDNALTWTNWDLAPWQKELRATVRYLIGLRREHRVLRPAHFYTFMSEDTDALPDLTWYAENGERMPEYRWFDRANRLLQMLRSGHSDDADALLVLNGAPTWVVTSLPQGRGVPFRLVWDSTWQVPRGRNRVYRAGATTSMAPFSMRLYLAG